MARDGRAWAKPYGSGERGLGQPHRLHELLDQNLANRCRLALRRQHGSPHAHACQGFFYRGGMFTNYVLPSKPTNTVIFGINDDGDFCGYYQNAPSFVSTGFLSDDGKITSFLIPGSTSLNPISINDFDFVAGEYQDSAGAFMGSCAIQKATFRRSTYPEPRPPRASERTFSASTTLGGCPGISPTSQQVSRFYWRAWRRPERFRNGRRSLPDKQRTASGLHRVPFLIAENSSRHLAELWRIEPEIAFAELADNAALAEALLKYTIAALLNERQEDLALFDQRIERGHLQTGLREKSTDRLARITQQDLDMIRGAVTNQVHGKTA